MIAQRGLLNTVLLAAGWTARRAAASALAPALLVVLLGLGCGKSRPAPAGSDTNSAGTPHAGERPVAHRPPSPAAPVRRGVPDWDRDLPGDRYKINPMGGYRYNATREKRRWRRAKAILDRKRIEMRKASPQKLLGLLTACSMCFGWTLEGVDYYVSRELNKLVEAELTRRGAAAEPTLRRCAKDRRALFTGSAGPPDTVGWMCRRVLKRLATKPPRP